MQIFQAGYVFIKKQIAMDFNKTTIMSLFYLARLSCITWKQKLQTPKISSKAFKHPFNKTLLVFTDFHGDDGHPHKPDKRSV